MRVPRRVVTLWGVVEHRRAIIEVSEGQVQAVCSCGWRSELFGEDKRVGTMDALQQAVEAADLHEWEADLS